MHSTLFIWEEISLNERHLHSKSEENIQNLLVGALLLHVLKVLTSYFQFKNLENTYIVKETRWSKRGTRGNIWIFDDLFSSLVWIHIFIKLTTLLSLTWDDTTLNLIWSCCTWSCTSCFWTSSLGSSRFIWFSSSIVLLIFFLMWRRVLNQTFLWWWKFHVMLLQWTRWSRVHTKKEAFLGQLSVRLSCIEAFRVGCRALLPELDLT
jgi:hypothetical protein